MSSMYNNEKGSFNTNKILTQKQADIFLKNIYLVFTGINRTAQFVANSYVKKFNDKKHMDLQEILKQVDIATVFLRNYQYEEFGRLLHENWIIKRKLSSKVSNQYIDDLYNCGLKNGAYGGKLLGAGGGGFLLFYVPKKNQEKFEKKFMNNYYFKPKSTNSGSIIKYV